MNKVTATIEFSFADSIRMEYFSRFLKFHETPTGGGKLYLIDSVLKPVYGIDSDTREYTDEVIADFKVLSWDSYNLEPCPHCGAEPHGSEYGHEFVYCKKCGVCGPLGDHDGELWNAMSKKLKVRTS